MLANPLIELLLKLRLHGVSQAYAEQCSQDIDGLDFDERLSLLLEREKVYREDKALALRLKQASLRNQACFENIDYSHSRSLSKKTMLSMQDCRWIKQHHNILITGPCGTGKTYLACALAHKACLEGYKAKYWRMTQLLQEIFIAKANANFINWCSRIAKIDVLIIDDWGLAMMEDGQKRDLLEILDDRYQRKTTIMASQLPVETWYEYINEPTLADAILDRVVHNAYRIQLSGESMRKNQNNVETKEAFAI